VPADGQVPVRTPACGICASGLHAAKHTRQFVLAYTAREFAESLHHIVEGKIDVTPLVKGTVGLEAVGGAFADLANPEKHAKVMVNPWA
jgi:threonine dehydrogenase-like Zn-dependent dehydrogenase